MIGSSSSPLKLSRFNVRNIFSSCPAALLVFTVSFILTFLSGHDIIVLQGFDFPPAPVRLLLTGFLFWPALATFLIARKAQCSHWAVLKEYGIVTTFRSCEYGNPIFRFCQDLRLWRNSHMKKVPEPEMLHSGFGTFFMWS